MDFELTEELQTVRDLTGRILGDRVTPERGSGQVEWMDTTAWRRLADAGLLGVALPEAAGGAGLGFTAAHLVLEQIGLAAAPLPFASTIVLGAMPVARFGTDRQREQLLPGVLRGDALLAAALTEETADPMQPRTAARRVDGGWELTGAKTLVAMAEQAGLLLVPATTDDGGVGVWLVATDAGGLSVRPQADISEQPLAEVTLDQVRVGPDALLGAPDGEVLSWLVLHGEAALASTMAGVCAAALRLSADYTSRREQFGRPVATFQAVAQRLADAYIDAEAIALVALQAAWRLSEDLPARDEVAIARWWAAEAGHRVLHAAQHVHGGVGVDRDYPLHRYFGMAKHLEFALGTGTGQLLRLGAAMAAEPA